MYKDFFQLIRLPGIFTAISNVLIGYFFVIYSSQSYPFPFLVITSGLLFSSGMIMNDYFDMKIDKIERPYRPLVSNRIKKKYALYIFSSLIISANLFAILTSFESSLITISMTGLIFLYNLKTKNYGIIGFFTLSSIRFLNVILGFTYVPLYYDLIYYAFPLLLFVFGISVLAKYETKEISKKFVKINLIFTIFCIFAICIFLVLDFDIISLGFLILFAIISLGFFSKSVNQKITIQLLSIIILDATIICIISTWYYGAIVILLILPSILISRKLYVT